MGYPSMMSRAETTSFLGEVLVRSRLRGGGRCWAREVTLGPKGSPRVDFLAFETESRQNLRGIEHGTFTGYEIKSCRDDVLSGHGLNHAGDVNYVVMPPWVWFDKRSDSFLSMQERLGGFGVLVPEFALGELVTGMRYPTSFLGYEARDFALREVLPPDDRRYSQRDRSTMELLFYMLRAGGES